MHCNLCCGGGGGSGGHGRHHPLQLALVVFFIGALAHLLMCAQTNRHTLQLALCGGGIYIYTYTLRDVKGFCLLELDKMLC